MGPDWRDPGGTTPDDELVRDEYDAGESAIGEKYELPYFSCGETALCKCCVRSVNGPCLPPLGNVPDVMLSPVVERERRLVLEAVWLAAECG